jgi:rhodanese-related sulfurtransferase
MSQPRGIPAVDPLYADIRRHDAVRPALIIDVREVSEFATVRVEGAALLPMSQVAVRLDEIPRDRPVLVLCNSGSRSATVAAHLLQHGWTDVGNIAGGIVGWERMGLPVKRGPIEPGEGSLPR